MKSRTPIESAGHALVRWAVEQQSLREMARNRHSGAGETVFLRWLPRLSAQKEKLN